MNSAPKSAASNTEGASAESFNQLMMTGLSLSAIASLLEIRTGAEFKESVRSCVYGKRDEVLKGAVQLTLGTARGVYFRERVTNFFGR